MELTARARARLDEYQAEARRAIASDPSVDPDAVVSGIEEHVESELAARGVERATAEDIADVLERLGSPSRWDASGQEGSRGSGGSSRAGSLGSGGGDQAGSHGSAGSGRAGRHRAGGSGQAAGTAARLLEVGAVSFAILGSTLLLAGFWGAAGWGFLLVAALLARVSVGE